MDLVFQIIWTVMGAVLSVVLTKLLIQNGREIRKLSERMDEGHRVMMDALLRIEEGQRKGFTTLEEGQREITKILLDHTKILERIEKRLG